MLRSGDEEKVRKRKTKRLSVEASFPLRIMHLVQTLRFPYVSMRQVGT